jgi:ankyrin repeat protein
LYICIENGTTIVELLLEHGSVLNAKTAWGDTAVQYSAYQGTLNNLKILIESGGSFCKKESQDEEADKISQKYNLPKVF